MKFMRVAYTHWYLRVPVRGMRSMEIAHYRRNQSAIPVFMPKTESEVEQWINKEVSNKEYQAVGFDTEWKPGYGKGEINDVSLVQVAAESGNVLLVQCNEFSEFPKALKDLIRSEKIAKVGVGIFEDLQKVCSDYSFTLDGGAWVDIGIAAKRTNVKTESFGLKALTKSILDTEVSKSRSVQMSNWARASLTSAQIQYATYDALMSLDVYKALESTKAFEIKKLTISDDNMFPADRQQIRGLKNAVSSRNDHRRLWLNSNESTWFQEDMSRKLRHADAILLQELLKIGPPVHKTGNSRAKPFYRHILMSILSRFGNLLAIRFHSEPKSRDSQDEGVTVHVLAGKRILASSHGGNHGHAAEQACFKLCKEIIDVQNEQMSNLEWFYACAGKGSVPEALLEWKYSKPSL